MFLLIYKIKPLQLPANHKVPVIKFKNFLTINTKLGKFGKIDIQEAYGDAFRLIYLLILRFNKTVERCLLDKASTYFRRNYLLFNKCNTIQHYPALYRYLLILIFQQIFPQVFFM